MGNAGSSGAPHAHPQGHNHAAGGGGGAVWGLTLAEWAARGSLWAVHCWGGLHQTFVKASVTTRDCGAVGLPFGPTACAGGGLGLPRIWQLAEVPTRKAGGLLIPCQAAMPWEAGPWERSALPKLVPRASVGGPMGAVGGDVSPGDPLGCDVGPAVPVAMRDPGSPCGARACAGRERPQELPGGTLWARGGRTWAGAARGPRRFWLWGVSSAPWPWCPPIAWEHLPPRLPEHPQPRAGFTQTSAPQLCPRNGAGGLRPPAAPRSISSVLWVHCAGGCARALPASACPAPASFQRLPPVRDPLAPAQMGGSLCPCAGGHSRSPGQRPTRPLPSARL